MNYRGRYRVNGLAFCPVCGLDSGVRKVRQTNPETFLVVCESCGAKTDESQTASAATKRWNDGRVHGTGRR